MIMRPAMFAIAIVIVGACAALAAGPPDAVDPGWWSRVQADIGRSEYEISWQNTTALPDLPGAWQAPNREQGFRTYFTPRGIRVVPRAATDPAWEWALTFAWYGRRDLRCPAVEGSLGVRANRIDYARGGVTEWFVNDERGLEHGFVLSEPAEQAGCAPVPAGGDEPRDAESLVRVALVLSGTLAPVISGDAQAVDFRDAGGRCAVHYAQLEVRDARGTRVPAWFEGFAAAGERGIQIVLDDTDAVYPITIDPLATSPAWNVYGGQAVAHYGYSVATAGDVNGDGFSDIIVGAPRYDGGETDEGRSYVYYGSPSGPSFAASWHEESDAADDRFGYSVATAGDVNGDGYSDIVVGVPRHMTSLIAEGVAYVYYGSAAGLPHEADKVLFDRDHLARALFGASVSTAGDVNGDGYSDVIVGAPGETPAVPERAFVYHGSADGLSNIATWIVQGDQADCGFAAAVSTAGDVDGDGYSEVIVGADQYTNGNTDEGKAFVYHGSGIGLSTTPAWSAEGNADEATLGISVGAAGDVNGDGYADIIIGAIFMGEHSQGAALVYHGSDRGLSTTCSLRIDGPGLGVAYFGWSVATAGDVNADGYADVIIGEYGHTGTHTSEGATYVHLGSRTGLDPNYAWRVEGGKANAAIGTAVATAGDVNGDGYADVIVASEWYQNTLAEEGRASVYLGSPAGLATTSGWNGEGNQASAYYGYALSSAGDVNGDGYSDIAVGAYSYDNGEVNEGRVFVYHGSASGPEVTAHWTAEGNQSSAYFGYAVARAGDVNGDGYDDLVVGAQRHDGKLTDEGRVMVYHGSPSGLSASAAWYKDGGQAGAEFGGAVAGAGDVNGDGFADIIIGARLYDSEGLADSGLALVYHGSVSGLGSSAAWSMSTKQVDARLGSAVASAGDINRDGYSDIIIGTEYYDGGQADEGIAYVWRGSATGVSGSVWSAEGNQTGAHFGRAVASAGDVNGDGFSDIVIGANLFDTGTVDAGRVFVYHGAASGLPSDADWYVTGVQGGAEFGASVAGAGDVNGDGFADLAIGARLRSASATRGGQVTVYHGSVAGLGAAADWSADGAQADQYFGSCVACAGDVNGDGYADLLVGSYAYDHGETSEGTAELFFGNDSLGLDLRPQQRGVGDSRPVAHLGASDAANGFRLAITARTPFGRGKVLLEREVKPLERLLDGRATEVAVEYRDTGPQGTRISLLESDLVDEKPYHWRVRLLYKGASTPYAQASRWLTLPVSGSQEAKLRTGDPAAAGRAAGLGLARAGTRIALSWESSCIPDDSDYVVYEGLAGDYYSHESRYCSTGGATTKTLTPLSGNTYYLVVPRNGTREGSYGTDSEGHERPQGNPACLPQQVAACP